MGNVPNEHRLYKALSVFVMNWVTEENEKGRKPFQSEIIGALEMVKHDFYAIQSADRILTKRLKDIFKVLKGKQMKIDEHNSIIIEPIPKEGDVDD